MGKLPRARRRQRRPPPERTQRLCPACPPQAAAGMVEQGMRTHLDEQHLLAVRAVPFSRGQRRKTSKAAPACAARHGEQRRGACRLRCVPQRLHRFTECVGRRAHKTGDAGSATRACPTHGASRQAKRRSHGGQGRTYSEASERSKFFGLARHRGSRAFADVHWRETRS